MTGQVATLPDQQARDRIATDLESNLLVEAGAGSGKTRSLVQRMVALVSTGTADVGEIAAVTFTRKAAGELRERFQEALEVARASAPRDTQTSERLERGLRDIDRAFMGTIHAFCARLLREQPLEAGIDPSFGETTAREADRVAARFWSIHLERLSADSAPILDELAAVGLRPQELRTLFDGIREYPDVVFPAEPVPFPSREAIAQARRAFEELIDEIEPLLPSVEPEPTWDALQSTVRRLLYLRAAARWQDDRIFLNALADFCGVREHKVVMKRWPQPERARALKDRTARFISGGVAARTAQLWQAHRYPIVLRFGQDAARALAQHRRTSGQLDFQDLLVLTAALLRDSQAARRHLGARYRRLLVDEFQDTDPIQAEILFLLASDPADHVGPAWHTAVPRPGALFVVGDPKQSIYRFRRADIQLYGQIRRRFEDFGAVVRLEANFRSSKRVADLVNDVFAGPGGFPRESTPEQAPFAELSAQRADHRHAGVFRYQAKSPGFRDHEIAAWDANALAGWVARRVASGERRAGDFLILVRTKNHLDRYARALEAFDLPVRVSGAGIGIEVELGEVRVLLQALADPGDAVKTVAVLIGLFFGLDHEQLLAHRIAGGPFDLRFAKSDEFPGPVNEALCTLRRWWEWSRTEPADGVIARIADEVGLLPYAAAGPLGAVRAGALAFTLDALRGAGLSGDTSLAAALEAMELAIAEDETEAPLEPGRTDVVRIMNLHKAKGLEADVVILARPFLVEGPSDDVFIQRDEHGTVGWMRVKDDRWRKARVLSRPLDWEEKEAAMEAFEAAEEVRLLYVAVTRARDELIVALPGKGEASPWAPLHGWLREHAPDLALESAPAPPRERLTSTAQDLISAERWAESSRLAAEEEGWRFATVTRLAKADGGPSSAGPGLDAGGATSGAAASLPLPMEPGSEDGPGGHAWGSAVHGVLEAATRGADRARLRTLARSLLLELDRPASGGEPLELEALVATVDRVLGSELWRRALGARRRLSEVPFTLERPGSGIPVYLEGVIDLAFAEEDGWVVVDYKTDRGNDPEFPARRNAYRAQLALYGDAWQELTGERVKERLLWFVRSGVIEPV